MQSAHLESLQGTPGALSRLRQGRDVTNIVSTVQLYLTRYRTTFSHQGPSVRACVIISRSHDVEGVANVYEI